MTNPKSSPARVDISLPRPGDREDPNLFVGINGVSYLLPRGKRSSVPQAVAAELRRSESARERLDETMNSLQSGGRA